MEGLTESKVRSLNVSELKEQLSKRSLAVTGKKADLVKRLLDDLNAEKEMKEENAKTKEEVEQDSEAPETGDTAPETGDTAPETGDTDVEDTNEDEQQMEATDEACASGEEQMDTGEEGTSQDSQGDATEAVELVHPQLEKLLAFKPNEWQLQEQIPQPPASLEEAAHTFVDTVALLQEMVAQLSKEKEIGVALQHTSSTTFLPCCQMLQISTRTHDYIIDVDALKDDVKSLNEIFTNESVMKVMSRQNYDLEVLAKTCGLWIINLFDVSTAGRLIDDGVAQAAMLKKYCFVENVTLNHKTNDWSVRPLSEDQLKHVRTNVRYLIYLHDLLRNKLVEKKLIGQLYDESTILCKDPAKPRNVGPTEKTWRKLYKKNKRTEGILNSKQMECFSLLCNWGYITARKLNKSLRLTLPIPTMFKIAKKLPRDVKGIAALYPDGVLPPHMEGDIQGLLKIIRQSINQRKKQGMADWKTKWEGGASAYGGRGRPFTKRGNPSTRGGYGTGPMHQQMGSRMSFPGPGMGPQRPVLMGPMGPRMGPMGPMDPRMGPMGPGMGPMDPRMGPMGPGMGPMDPRMGPMGPPMGHMGPRMGHISPSGLRNLIGKFIDETVQGYGNYSQTDRGGVGGHQGRGRGRGQIGGMRGRR